MFFLKRRPPVAHGLVAVLLLLAVLALAPAACGGGADDETTSTAATTGGATTVAGQTTTSAARATTTAPATPASTEGATTTAPAASSTTTGATQTTAGSSTTATTAKATTTTAKATTTTVKPTTTTAAQGPVVLTLVGPSGTKTFTMAQLKALPAVSGYGGWKNQLGNITAPMSWKGPSMSSLVKLVGGGGSVTVVASDGYSSSIVPGASKATYDPATGESISGIAVTAILAYSKNGGAMGGDEGPLRVAFVSPEQNQVTDGSEWARMVVELRVK